MPRSKIDLPYHVDFLSILDAEGNLDESLEPDIPEEILLRIHATMLLGRRFDERLTQPAATGPHRNIPADNGAGGFSRRSYCRVARFGLDGPFLQRNGR
jgi:hypothetical protein